MARPSLVPRRRRALVLLHSLAEPIAWAGDLRIRAYASAVAVSEHGRRARRTYLRLSRPDERAVRRALAVRWLGETCTAEECERPVARWLDDRTIEISRYEWPERRLPIRTAQCTRLARTRPRALEVAADVTSSINGLLLADPRPSRWMLSAAGGALTSRREIELDDPMRARTLQMRLRMRAPFSESALVPLDSARRRIERVGERVTVTEVRLWEEVELAVEDERLRLRALAANRHRREPLPLDRVGLENLAALRHQISLRQAELDNLAPDRRERAAAELVSLLSRAFAAHPAELDLAVSLVRIHTEMLRDPNRALAVVDDVLARGIADHDERWRTIRREVVSAISERALADALVIDLALTPTESAMAAADLRALTHAGVPYEWAEGAWRMSREIFAGSPPSRTLGARVPVSGLFAALVAWARIGGAPAHATVQIALRSSRAQHAHAIGESRPEIIGVRAANGGMIHVAGVPSTDLFALRRLGAAMSAAAEAGPVEISIRLCDIEGAELIRMRLAGALLGEDLVIERVSNELESVSVPIFDRYLARPMAELHTAFFPPPTLTFRTESAELAAELRRLIETTDPDACSAAGPILRCQRPGRPELLVEMLLRIAQERSRMQP